MANIDDVVRKLGNRIAQLEVELAVALSEVEGYRAAELAKEEQDEQDI